MILVTYSNILIGPLMIYAAAVAIRKYQFCVGKKKLDNSTKMLINGWKKLVNQPINFTSILVVQSQYNFICACHVSEASKIQKEIVANFHTNSEHHILVRSQIGTKKFSQKDKNTKYPSTYGYVNYSLHMAGPVIKGAKGLSRQFSQVHHAIKDQRF